MSAEQAPKKRQGKKKVKRRKLIRAFCRNECCRDESTMVLSTTLNILTESLSTNPQGWKTMLELTKTLKSLDCEKVKTAVWALTRLWSGKWDDAEDEGRWNPGFSSMVGLPDDVYQAHLEALRDMLQFKGWRKYTYEDKYNYDEEDESDDPIIQEAYLIASIRDDFEQIIPQHLLPLLREIQSLASTIMSKAVDNISKYDHNVSWTLMKDICVLNRELVKPYLPQLCRATCNKLLRGGKAVNGRLFWVALCKTADLQYQEVMTEIALAASQLSVCDDDCDDDLKHILTVGIKCGIWTCASFARFIETSFKSLSSPWTPSLTRFLLVLLKSYESHPYGSPAVLALLKQVMHGITDIPRLKSPKPNSVLELCVTHFPSALFCTTANVSWFLSCYACGRDDVCLALNYILEKPKEEDISLLDVESLVMEAMNKEHWGEYDHRKILSDLLNYPDKLTMKNAVGMLTMLSKYSTSHSDRLLNSAVQLLIQCVKQVGLTTSILQTTLGVARKKMGSQWESSLLVTLELDDGNVHQTKRVCRRFNQSFNPNFTAFNPTTESLTASSNSNGNAPTTESLIKSFEKLCCQLVSVALTFSQTVFEVTRGTLTETPAALVVEYLELVCV